MSDFVELTCPFCGEDDFDDVGLKIHLINYCEKYSDIDIDWRNRLEPVYELLEDEEGHIDELDLQEIREEEEDAVRSECICGAWQFNKKTWLWTHVADCVCGA